MMKIKWVELKEDDPIFKGGFIISPLNIKAPKKTDKGVIGFKGVYSAKYIIIEINPKNAVLKFII